MTRRTAAFELATCNITTLQEWGAQFPESAWSMNHYMFGQAEVMGKDFVNVSWGKETYEFLLGVKMMYDPANKIGCSHCVAWPPISQNNDIMKINPFYYNSLALKDPK